LSHYKAEAARIESLEHKYAGSFDVVTSRAFASLDLFIKCARPFLNKTGRILAMKSAIVDGEIESAGETLRINNMYISEKKDFSLYPSGSKRVLLDIRIGE